MKGYHFIFACLAMCTPLTALAQSPTLTETTEWLRENLPAKASYASSDAKGATTARVNDVEITGCQCKLTASLTVSVSGISVTANDRYTFTANNISLEGITVQEWTKTTPTAYYLYLRSPLGQTPFRNEGVRNGKVVSTSQTNEIKIMIDSKETAERFQKAFKHYATLCQQPAKKEPF